MRIFVQELFWAAGFGVGGDCKDAIRKPLAGAKLLIMPCGIEKRKE